MEKISLINYKKFIKQLNIDELDILGDDYTSCWLYSYFIHKIFNLPIENYECVYINNINNMFDLNLDTNGIYSFYMDNNIEMHHFILFVIDNEITLTSTYGGQNGIIKITRSKNIFINNIKLLFSNINENTAELYCDTFGIINKSKMFSLNLSKYNLMYTYKSFEYN